MQERPADFYRLLHVRRDAPPAVIRASYRAMMQKLRHHPDLGGDEAVAVRLNEAMATLGDPSARARYDTALDGVGAAAATAGESVVATGRDERSAATRAGRAPYATADDPTRHALGPPRGAAASARTHCPFCRAPHWSAPSSTGGYAEQLAAQCHRCGGPVRQVAVPRAGDACPGADGANSAERRRLHRSAYSDRVRFWRRWPLEEARIAEMADLSSSGCALESDVECRRGEVWLFTSRTLDAIGEVRSCRASADGRRFRTGLAFLTTRVHTVPGTLYSTTV